MPKPATETFEYNLWGLLNDPDIPANARTRIGNAILALAKTHLGISDGPARTRFIPGSIIHYFPRDDDPTARCGRATRSQLQPNRIVRLPHLATCSHCIRGLR
jgi:hypothetical protein